MGAPTCSIQWGPWAGGGMAAAQRGTSARLATLGLGLIAPLVGLRVLQDSLTATPTSGGEWGHRPLTVVLADWARLAAHSTHSHQLLSHLTTTSSSEASSRYAATVNIWDDSAVQQAATSPADEESRQKSTAWIGKAAQMKEEISSAVASVIASIMGQEVRPEQPLMAAGLDSLGAVEVRNSLQQRLSIELPATVIFDYPTPTALSDYILTATAKDARTDAAHADVDVLGDQLQIVELPVPNTLAEHSANLPQVVMASGFAGMSPGMRDLGPALGDHVGLIPLSR